MKEQFQHFVVKDPVAGRCEKSVNKTPTMRFPRFGQCSRKATVVCEGHHYCKLHDPEVVAEKARLKTLRQDQQFKALQESWQRKAELHGKGQLYDDLRAHLIAVATELKRLDGASQVLQSLPEDIKSEIGIPKE